MIKCIQRFIAANKFCIYAAMAILGFAAGMIAAKITVDKCSCTNKFMCVAKKAMKMMEDKLMA